MTRIDAVVVGTLVVLLAVVAGVIGVPAFVPSSASPSPTVDASGDPALRPYVEGALGAPVSVSPLTARSQADRDLVALVFAGLVRNGPAGTIVPDLASSWSVDSTGRTWTVRIRDDATWHDGQPVTSDDVLYTIGALQDPAYTGPSATSWSEVRVGAPDAKTVTFTLATPLGGFLQALTQPLAPAHILGDVPVDLLIDHPFGRAPIGAGPFSLTVLTDTHASLVPAIPATDGPEATPSAPVSATDSLASAAPTVRPQRPLPYLAGIEMRYFTEPADLLAAYRSGTLDAASGLSPADANTLADAAGTRVLHYPGATLTAGLLNLAPDHPEFQRPDVRLALLAYVDRAALITAAFDDAAVLAVGLIPPSSVMFDAASSPPVAYDAAAAQRVLEAADWTKEDDGWHLPGADDPLAIEVLSPTEEASPSVYAAAVAVVAAWTAAGFETTHVALPPGDFVTERLRPGAFQVAVADVTIGLDPDLYPLLASSQTLEGGSNVMGVQDPALDVLLEAARAPGTDEERKADYKALQVQLAAGRYMLQLAWADELAVVRDTVEGPTIRQVVDASDRFWDVLTWRLADGR